MEGLRVRVGDERGGRRFPWRGILCCFDGLRWDGRSLPEMF